MRRPQDGTAIVVGLHGGHPPPDGDDFFENMQRSSTQSARACFGILLLMLCFMLAQIQDAASSTQQAPGNREPLSKQMRDAAKKSAEMRASGTFQSWVRGADVCDSNPSRIGFFSVTGDPIVNWQTDIPSANLAEAATLFGHTNLLTGAAVWSSVQSVAGPTDLETVIPSRVARDDLTLHTGTRTGTELVQIIPLRGPYCDTGTSKAASCFLGLQRLLPESCSQALAWERQFGFESGEYEMMFSCLDRSTHPCYRLVADETVAGLFRKASLTLVPLPHSSLFCGEIDISTLSFNSARDQVLFTSRVPLVPEKEGKFPYQSATCLWELSATQLLRSAQPPTDFACLLLPEVDEKKAAVSYTQAASIPLRLGHTMAQQQPSAQDAWRGRTPPDAVRFVNTTNYQEPSLPLMVLPSAKGDHVAVLRTFGTRRKDLVVTVLNKANATDDWALLKSLQFDGMTAAYVIDAPTSRNDDFLLLMGASAPYSFQVQAIELTSGFVDTRHALGGS